MRPLLAAALLLPGCGLLFDVGPEGDQGPPPLPPEAWEGPDEIAGPLAFAPAMDKRGGAEGSPFEAGLLIQTSPGAPARPAGDVVGVPAGSRLGDTLHEHLDLAQGSIVLWLRPEWPGLQVGAARTLFSLGGIHVTIEPGAPDTCLRVRVTDATGAIVDESICGPVQRVRPNRASFFALRWDSRAPIARTDEGDAHVVVDVPESRPLGFLVDRPWAPPSEPPLGFVGSEPEGTGSIDGVISGLTVYRRVLFDEEDGSGVDLGHGDELGRMRGDLGEPQDPVAVTGAWDVLLALPTEQSAGPVTEELEAWTQPTAGHLLGDGGWLASDGAASRWAGDGGAATTRAPPAQSVFGSSLAVTSGFDVGVSSVADFPPQGSVVVRALAHAGSGHPPLLRLFCAGSGDRLAHAHGSAGSSRDRPDELVVTVEPRPSECGRLRVELGADVPVGETATTIWHSIAVVPSLVLNPSFERGDPGGEFPDAWDSDSVAPTSSGAPEWSYGPDAAHGGARYVAIAADPGDPDGVERLKQEILGLADGRYYDVGAFFRYREGSDFGIGIGNGSLFAHTLSYAERNKLGAGGERVTGPWQHVHAVGRRLLDSRHNNHFDLVHWGCGRWGEACAVDLDDVYVVPLAPVALRVRPADEAASSAVAPLVRVDGLDRVSQPITAWADRGHLSFGVRTHRAPHDVVDSCTGAWQIARVEGDARNYIQLRGRGPHLELEVMAAGAGAMATFSDRLPSDREAPHPYVIRWRAGFGVEVLVDGARAGALRLPAAFERDPTTLELLSGPEDGRCDGFVETPGATSRLLAP